MESSALALARELLSDRQRGVLRADGSVDDNQDATLYVLCTNVLTPVECASVVRGVAAAEVEGSKATLCGGSWLELSNFASGTIVRAGCESLRSGREPAIELLQGVQPLASGQDPRASAPDADLPSLWEGWTGASVLLPLLVLLALVLAAWWVIASQASATTAAPLSSASEPVASGGRSEPKIRTGF